MLRIRNSADGVTLRYRDVGSGDDHFIHGYTATLETGGGRTRCRRLTGRSRSTLAASASARSSAIRPLRPEHGG
jgi:hypothetical protein